MARIAGIDLPKDKRIEIGLTYIYGIGRKSAKDILAQTGINPDIRVRISQTPMSRSSATLSRPIPWKATCVARPHWTLSA